MRIFVSTKNTSDTRVAQAIDALRALPDVEVDHSPLNHMLVTDPRWKGWYGDGCKEAIAAADCFVALASTAYDNSTWMAYEFEVAVTFFGERGKPRLFLSKVDDQPLATSFAAFEAAAAALPAEPAAAAAAFASLALG